MWYDITDFKSGLYVKNYLRKRNVIIPLGLLAHQTRGFLKNRKIVNRRNPVFRLVFAENRRLWCYQIPYRCRILRGFWICHQNRHSCPESGNILKTKFWTKTIWEVFSAITTRDIKSAFQKYNVATFLGKLERASFHSGERTPRTLTGTGMLCTSHWGLRAITGCAHAAAVL